MAPTAAYAAIPGVDEIASSDNITQIANTPKPIEFGTGLNSDLAFQGNYAFSGNYNGFVTYDISDPAAPAVVSQVVCVGSQNDISVLGDLLFLSTDDPRSDDSCNSTAPTSAATAWEGIKIFDISDKSNPKYIKSVETACGSHTHTLIPGESAAYLYVSSYRPSASNPKCLPPHDAISIVKVPLDAPTTASVVAVPNLFPDGGTPAGGYSSATSGCHDITAYPSKKIAAGACMGDGILLDISNVEAPVVTERVKDLTNFAFWHSASFNNAGTKVVFTDELGGGGAATCNPAIGPNRGADAVYDLVGGKLTFKSYFKIPRENASTENCVAHNGSLIPAFGKDILVQAWYQGGVSVWDFTDSANPVELGYWERGPVSATRLSTGGSWSAYYYNGYIYSNDITKGFDVLKLSDPRTDSAKAVHFSELNVQTQPEYPACTSVLTGRQQAIAVTTGVTCVDTGDLRGTVTIAEGATLQVYKTRVSGPVTVTGGGTLSIVDSDLRGAVVTNGLKSVYLAGNAVASAVVVNGTTGSAIISGNELRGGVYCADNAVAPVDEGKANTIRGAAFGQCAELR